MSSRWVSFVCAALLTLGCLKPPSMAGTTDAAWVELKSPHFRLVTDLDEPEGARVLAGFEEIYALLGSVAFREGAVPSFTTQAIIFNNHRDVEEFAGQGFGGVYMPSLPNDPEPSPTLLASGTLSPFARRLFAHELMHRFNHAGLGPTPAWLNEGLADYYSTVRAADGKPVLGEIDPRSMCTPNGLGDLMCREYERIRGGELPRASELVAMQRDAFYGPQPGEEAIPTWEQMRRRSKNYGMSWLLVHLLMHTDHPYAKRFRGLLATPPSGKKGAALAEAVQTVPAAQLDRDLSAYLQKKLPWRQHHAGLPPAPAGVTRRALSRSETLVWLARLDRFDGPNAGRAEQRLGLARDATNGRNDSAAGGASFWLGRYQQLQGRFPQAEQHYREALSLEPDNADYLYGLLDLYWTAGQTNRTEAARSPKLAKTIEALVPAARSAYQLNAVAAYQLFTNAVSAALATSARACAAGPDCWSCFHNRAAVLFAAGQAGEALEAEREAQARQSESLSGQSVALVSAAVAFYSQAVSDPESVEGKPRPSLVAP
jgi:hypothetical protein